MSHETDQENRLQELEEECSELEQQLYDRMPPPGSVFVQFFKPAGRWHSTETFEWPEAPDGSARNVLREVISSKHGTLAGFWAVCIEQPGEDSQPIMIKVP